MLKIERSYPILEPRQQLGPDLTSVIRWLHSDAVEFDLSVGPGPTEAVADEFAIVVGSEKEAWMLSIQVTDGADRFGTGDVCIVEIEEIIEIRFAD